MRATVSLALIICGVVLFPRAACAEDAQLSQRVADEVEALIQAQVQGDKAFESAAGKLALHCNGGETEMREVQAHGPRIRSAIMRMVGPTRAQTRSVNAVKLMGCLGAQSAMFVGLLNRLGAEAPLVPPTGGQETLAEAEGRILEAEKNEAARNALTAISLDKARVASASVARVPAAVGTPHAPSQRAGGNNVQAPQGRPGADTRGH